MAKNKFDIELDFDQMINDYLNVGDQTLNGYLVNSARDHIRNKIDNEIEEIISKDGWSLNQANIVKKSFSEYLDDKIKSILNKGFDDLVNKYMEERMKKELGGLISSFVSNYVEEKFYPHLQNIISNSLVVNRFAIDAEIDMMNEYAQDQAQGAYEAGVRDGSPF